MLDLVAAVEEAIDQAVVTEAAEVVAEIVDLEEVGLEEMEEDTVDIIAVGDGGDQQHSG